MSSTFGSSMHVSQYNIWEIIGQKRLFLENINDFMALIPVVKEESHFFRLIGQAKPRIMFLDGTEPLMPGVESLAQVHTHTEDDDTGNVYRNDLSCFDHLNKSSITLHY